MKKNIMLVIMSLVVMLILSACGFDSTSADYEARLLKMSAENFSEFREASKQFGERTYEISYSNDIYSVDINGQKFQVQMPQGGKKLKISGAKKCTSKSMLKLVNESKSLVKGYIKSSNVLKDKEQLISALDEIEVKIATFDAPALYQDETIYLCQNFDDAVCEWMIVHELVHFIAELTNDGIENEPYAYYLFNEALTDIITMSMNPDIPYYIMSGYSQYHEITLIYTGIFQEKALEAYFYGYDSIWEKIGKVEFDFFVYSFENFYSEELARTCVANSLYKWTVA